MALAYAERGLYVFPLHPRTKKPIPDNGRLAATLDPAKIENWWRSYPDANIGIALVPSGLLIIGPDNEYWHNEFKARGLPDTYTVQSGNGYHYYYNASADTPQKRICHSHEYDILTDGYIVAAGSVHPNGKIYTALNDHPVADAPEWVLDELNQAAEPGDVAAKDANEPPVRLCKSDLAWWQGKEQSTKVDGSIDRSATLYTIACRLAEHDLTRTAIADALENRDTAIFTEPKFIGRTDEETRYLSIADSAIDAVISQKQTTAVHLNGRHPKHDTFPHTDIGNAERFIAQHGAYVRFVYERQKWAVYDGTRWLLDEPGSVNQLAKQTVRKIYHDAANEDDAERRKTLADHARNSESAYRIRSLLDRAQHEPGITVSIKAFDKDPMIINTLSATIDLRTNTQRPHNPADMLMKQMPVQYRAGVVSDKWERFIARIQPNEDMRRFLQRMAGYLLTGLTTEEVFFILYGGGENGKGTFVETLQALFADYGLTAQMATFISKHNEGGDRPSPDLARMVGARMVAVSETNENAKFNEGLIKSLTGGDTITARYLHADYFSFLPTHKHIFAVNHRPDIGDTTKGMWRRVRLVPFEETISAEERDNDLKRALREEELQGVLNWCLTGCRAWQEEGLNAPKTVTDATQEYRNDSDPLQRWIDEYCDVDSNTRTDSTTLYESYKGWCELNHEKWKYQRYWGEDMKTKGYKPYRTNIERGYSGIKLNDRAEAAKDLQGQGYGHIAGGSESE